MSAADRHRIRSIGDEVDYADNAESKILEILEEVDDPSDGSDELAARIVDWPTRYHCSPQRSNLLRPFEIPRGARVLEIGAGTGALTRYLLELGIRVTAVEGTRARAESIAARCRGLKGLELICGDFKNFDDPQTFDFVLVVGVLEYAGSAAGGGSGPRTVIERVASFLKPDGALVLGIENQLGLKYLLGGKEDHLGQAWIGIEGYPGRHGVRTWGRERLGALLRAGGLDHQRWFFPFPDYKTPTAVLTEAIYDHSEAPTIIDQWTAPPIVDHADPDRPIHDDRAAHRVFLDEGLGREISNSFLVAAGRTGKSVERVASSSTLLWHFGGERRKARRRRTTVGPGDEGALTVRSRILVSGADPSGESWIAFRPERHQPLFIGPNLEQELLDACRKGEVAGVDEVLDRWQRFLSEHCRIIEPASLGIHPYLTETTTEILDADFLDIQPSNFIATPSGLELIDREWVAGAAVDINLVRLRAMWYLARMLVVSGTPLPWPEETTVESLAARWIGRWTTPPDAGVYSTFYQAETALQVEVSSADALEIEQALRAHGRLSRAAVVAGQDLGRPDTRAQNMSEIARYQRKLETQLREAKHYTSDLESQLQDQRKRADEADLHFQSARSAIDELEAELSRAANHIGNLEAHLHEASHHFEKTETEIGDLRSALTQHESALADKNTVLLEMNAALAKADTTIADLVETNAALAHDLENADITTEQLQVRLAEEEGWRKAFENRPLVRLYRRLRWWLPQKTP